MGEQPKGAVALGRKMYFFKSLDNVKECLISAHGGYWRSNNTFPVPPGVTIHFYAPHEYSLQDPGIAIMRFSKLAQQAVETKNAGDDCINYGLSKYQGKHNKAGETYDSINGLISSEAAEARKLIDQIYMQPQKNAINTAAKKTSLKDTGGMNILTIRNRAFAMEVTLKEAVETVRKSFPGVVVFHCSFCRSSMNPFTPDKSYKLGVGPVVD